MSDRHLNAERAVDRHGQSLPRTVLLLNGQARDLIVDIAGVFDAEVNFCGLPDNPVGRGFVHHNLAVALILAPGEHGVDRAIECLRRQDARNIMHLPIGDENNPRPPRRRHVREILCDQAIEVGLVAAEIFLRRAHQAHLEGLFLRDKTLQML